MARLSNKARLALILSCFCVLALISGWPRETSYQGVSVSQWLKRHHCAYQRRFDLTGGEAAWQQTRADLQTSKSALVAIGPKAVPILLQKIQIEDTPDRIRRAEWCERIGWKSHPFQLAETEHEVAIAGFEAVGERGESAVPILRGMFLNPATTVRVLPVLGNIGKPAIRTFADGLRSPDPLVRQCALRGLFGQGTNAAYVAPEVRALLKAPEEHVRAWALFAFAAVAPPTDNVIQVVISFLEDPMPGVCMMACTALAWSALHRNLEVADLIGGARAMSKLLEHPDKRLRSKAATELSKFKKYAEPAIPRLIELLKDPDSGVRTSASSTLVSIKLRLDEVIPALAELLDDTDDWVRESAAVKLRGLEPDVEKVRPGLIESLGSLGKAEHEALKKLEAEFRSNSGIFQSNPSK